MQQAEPSKQYQLSLSTYTEFNNMEKYSRVVLGSASYIANTNIFLGKQRHLEKQKSSSFTYHGTLALYNRRDPNPKGSQSKTDSRKTEEGELERF